MAVFDGLDTFGSEKPVTSARLNKTVLWRGTVLPIAGVNQIPTDGIFLKINTGVMYQNIGDTQNPNWSKISSGAEPGTITDFAGLESKIPAGYLRCNGASLLKSQYLDLYDVLGDTWGSVDSTHFNLPDLETDNRFTRATDSDMELGETGGESEHTLTIDEMPSHNHGVNDPGHSHGGGSSYSTAGYGPNSDSELSSTATATTGISIQNKGGSQSHENKPPYASVYKIIKT